MIFVGQSLFTIKLETSIDLTSNAITQVFIVAQKPNGSIVTWASVVDGTKISYSVQNGDIDQAGTWNLQAKIQDSANRVGLGKIATLKVTSSI